MPLDLLAIDPGNTESAVLIYDAEANLPEKWAKLPNEEALEWIAKSTADEMHVEMIASYGMAVGASVFETCVWIGRFLERWQDTYRPSGRVMRGEVKMHLCGSMRAKDANIRQALIDRYGGKEDAIGRKATPGPLYGMSGDCWSALAVAVTVAERPVLELNESSAEQLELA
jgi:hypothetical protein